MKDLSINYDPVLGIDPVYMVLRNYLLSGKLLHFIMLISLCMAVYVGQVIVDINTTRGSLKLFFQACSFKWLNSMSILSHLEDHILFPVLLFKIF